MSSQLQSTLTVERHGRVGWLVFNRPDSGNAMNAAMIDELEAAWRELNADPQVRVIVNTGTGRAFQTGLDVVELAQNPDALREQITLPGPVAALTSQLQAVVQQARCLRQNRRSRLWC